MPMTVEEIDRSRRFEEHLSMAIERLCHEWHEAKLHATPERKAITHQGVLVAATRIARIISNV